MKRTVVMTTVAVLSFLLMTLAAYGGQHTWRFSEFFSNPDGTIAFIELQEIGSGCCEYGVSTLNSASGGGLYVFPFPTNHASVCPGCSTSFAKLLVATQGFADMPGAPPPDYILPDGYINLIADTLTYSVYHTIGIGPMPTNGMNSLQVGPGPLYNTISVAVNTPTNMNGDTANVIARCKVSDFNQSGSVNVTDLLRLLAEWGSCPPPCDMDLDFSGSVNVTDLLTLLADWGDCPP